jgi:hypothetical protein
MFGFKMIANAGSNIPTPNISNSIPKNIKIKRRKRLFLNEFGSK